MEARVGIEPTNAAFAEPCLTTWLPRSPRERQHIIQSGKTRKPSFPANFSSFDPKDPDRPAFSPRLHSCGFRNLTCVVPPLINVANGKSNPRPLPSEVAPPPGLYPRPACRSEVRNRISDSNNRQKQNCLGACNAFVGTMRLRFGRLDRTSPFRLAVGFAQGLRSRH